MESNYKKSHSHSQLYFELLSVITTAIYGDRNNIMSMYKRLYADGEKYYAWHNSDRQIKMNVCKQTK